MKNIVLLFSVALVIFGCSSNNNGTVTVVPLAPTNLTGTVISTAQINLSWTDNATNEDGYKIERKTGTGNYAVVGSTGSNMTTFSDLGLTPSSAYTYRVYAYNTAGNSIQYSNEVTLSTQDSIPSWLTNGLVGYWPFNGNANDESGNGNNGTVNGATLTSDRNGLANRAYKFDKNNSNYINGNLNINGNVFSESVWAKHMTLRTGTNGAIDNDWLISMGQTNPVEVLEFGVYSNSNQLSFGKYNDVLFLTNATIDTTWKHYVIIQNNGIYSIYQNGILISQHNGSVITLAGSNKGYFFGKQWSPYNEYWNGSLDDIRIYNRALSASEVAHLAAH